MNNKKRKEISSKIVTYPWKDSASFEAYIEGLLTNYFSRRRIK